MSLTGKNYKTLREKYGLKVFIQNLGLEGYGSEEPALIIGCQRFGKKKAVVIPLSSAHKYRDDTYLVEQCFQCAQNLGFGFDKNMAMKIADAILDGLDDLVKFAPDEEPTFTEELEKAYEEQGLRIQLNGKDLLN